MLLLICVCELGCVSVCLCVFSEWLEHDLPSRLSYECGAVVYSLWMLCMISEPRRILADILCVCVNVYLFAGVLFSIACLFGMYTLNYAYRQYLVFDFSTRNYRATNKTI